jgi:hypothetical protein
MVRSLGIIEKHVQESDRSLTWGIRLEGLRKTSLSPGPLRHEAALLHSLSPWSNVRIFTYEKSTLRTQNHIFIWPQLQLSTEQFLAGNRDGSAGIMTRLRDEQPRNRGSIAGRSKRYFTSPRRPGGSHPYPAFHLMGSRESTPGVLRPAACSWRITLSQSRG